MIYRLTGMLAAFSRRVEASDANLILLGLLPVYGMLGYLWLRKAGML